MNKLQAYFRVICAPIRSWSDISAQHFPSLPPGELCFWRPEILSRRPEILYRLINMYQLNILSCTSHLVTMSVMPPVDNYITIYIFIEKPWQALDITMVGVHHVQMWKWIVMIFLCDISGARGMLKSLRNHRQSQRPNGKKWRIVGGRCWEKNCLSRSLNRLQLSLYHQTGGTRRKYNYLRRKGLREQLDNRAVEQRWSDTQFADWVSGASRV